MPAINILLAVLLLVFGQACTIKQESLSYSTIPHPPPPSAKEKSYGTYLYNKMSDRYPLDVSSEKASRLRSVSDELTRASGFRRLFWNVHLFNAPDIIDVRAVEGNRIFVWSGLLDTVSSDDELAAVLAWEMGHSLAQHTKPVKFNVWTKILFEAAEQATAIGLAAASQGAVNITGASGWMQWAYVEMVDLGPLERTYSADKEMEAAQIALHIMARSNYDPQAVKSYWTNFHRFQQSGDKHERLSRDVSPQERLAILDQLMGEIAAVQIVPTSQSKYNSLPDYPNRIPAQAITVESGRNYIIIKSAAPPF